MNKKVAVITTAGLLTVGLFSGVLFNREIGLAKSKYNMRSTINQAKYNTSTGNYENMINIMEDNGLKDMAEAMKNGDYKMMGELMNNISEEEYKRMIDLMKQNGYGSMARMMESLGVIGMIRMYDSMGGGQSCHGGGNNRRGFNMMK